MAWCLIVQPFFDVNNESNQAVLVPWHRRWDLEADDKGDDESGDESAGKNGGEESGGLDVDIGEGPYVSGCGDDIGGNVRD